MPNDSSLHSAGNILSYYYRPRVSWRSPCLARTLVLRITSAALYRGSCVVSTECKHPTLTRSSDYQDDHGTTDFEQLLFFKMFKNSSRPPFEAIQDDNRADQNNWFIGDNLVQIAPIGKINPSWNRIFRFSYVLTVPVTSSSSLVSSTNVIYISFKSEIEWIHPIKMTNNVSTYCVSVSVKLIW